MGRGRPIRDELQSESALEAAHRVTSAEAVAAVRRHPNFPRYMVAMFGIWSGGGDDDRILSQIQWDLGRWLAGVWAMYLDATPGGITQTRLAALLERAGVSSGTRSRTLLLFLRFVGFIEPAPPGPDRRNKVWVPSPRLRAAFVERFRREYRCMSQLEPVPAGLADRLDTLEFFRPLIATLGELALEGFKVIRKDDGPRLDIISQRYGGMTMLGHLFAAGAPTAEAYPPKGLISFSMKGVAERSGISRAQLRRTLEVGEKAGFFRFPRDGEVELTPLVVEHGEFLAAGTYLMIEWATAQALAACRREAT